MKRRLVNAINEGIVFLTFIALTYNDDSVKYQENDINRFMTWLRNYATREGGKLTYFWKMELDSSGRRHYNPHYHLLTNLPFVSIERITKNWGNGFCWIERIENEVKTLNYIGKYFGKNGKDRKGSVRRYGCSQDIPKTPPSQWKYMGELSLNERHETVDLWNTRLPEDIERSKLFSGYYTQGIISDKVNVGPIGSLPGTHGAPSEEESLRRISSYQELVNSIWNDASPATVSESCRRQLLDTSFSLYDRVQYFIQLQKECTIRDIRGTFFPTRDEDLYYVLGKLKERGSIIEKGSQIYQFLCYG